MPSLNEPSFPRELQIMRIALCEGLGEYAYNSFCTSLFLKIVWNHYINPIKRMMSLNNGSRLVHDFSERIL